MATKLVGRNKEVEFNEENYEEFYAHHQFAPIKDEDATNVHEIVPRFGWAFDQVEELKPKTLLDLGCLDGSFALTVAKHHGCEVTGIDLTQDGIDIARRRAAEHGLPATFHQGAIEDVMPTLEPHSFDVVTWFEIIEHVKDVQAVIKAIDRLVKPGGSILVSTPDFESPLYGKDDEQNKCHIRLYTTAEEDYEAVNKYGNVRKATSIIKEIGKDRIQDIGTFSHLIHVRYK